MSGARRMNVAVLMGGPTPEHEVSIQTGRIVANALDRSRYNVKPVEITRSGEWRIPAGYLPADGPPLPLEPGSRVDMVPEEALPPARASSSLACAADGPVDVVFIAMHGPYGEDGTVQGMLEVLGIPYTGSGVLASALAMHKVRTGQVLRHYGLVMPACCCLSRGRFQQDPSSCVAQALGRPGVPCVVKPVSQGSSVATTICHAREELAAALELAFQVDTEVMVEECIEGTELTCGVVERPDGTGNLALPLIEIVPKTSAFFDYEAKYTPGATDEICPARVPDDVAAEVQRQSLTAHETLGCSGFSRSDFILRDGRLYFLEINTIPGMTQTSLLPQAAAKAGVGFPTLLDNAIQCALRRHRERLG